jgi:hypothetical protein
VSQGTISAWELAVEHDRQEQLAVPNGEAFTLPNGETYTAEEWQFEVDNYREEERQGKFQGMTDFFDVTGMTAEQHGKWNVVAQKYLEEQEEVKRGKKRKQEAEAQKKVRD